MLGVFLYSIERNVMLMPAPKKCPTSFKDPKIIYEIADLSESQKWILMVDDTARVHRRYLRQFIDFYTAINIKPIERKPVVRVGFIDYLNKEFDERKCVNG